MGIHKGTKLTNTPKEKMLRVRVDKQTETELEYLTQKLNLSKSEVIRNGISEQYKREKKK